MQLRSCILSVVATSNFPNMFQVLHEYLQLKLSIKVACLYIHWFIMDLLENVLIQLCN